MKRIIIEKIPILLSLKLINIYIQLNFHITKSQKYNLFFIEILLNGRHIKKIQTNFVNKFNNKRDKMKSIHNV